MRYTTTTELIIFGICSALGIGAGLYSTAYNSTPGMLLSFGFATVTLIAFAILTIAKYIELQRFNVKLNHGIYVDLNGYNCTTDTLNAELERMIALYSNVIPQTKSLLEQTSVCCTFIPGVFQADGMTVAGLTSSDTIQVSYYTRDANNKCIVDANINIENTAFAHELGHVVLQRYSPGISAEDQHTFMKNHNLP